MSALTWLIPLLPLIGFLINGLGFRKIPKNAAAIIGCGSVLASFLIVCSLFIQSLAAPVSQRIDLYTWIAAGNYSVSFSFLIDHLSIIMMMIVTGVGFLIHVYSIGYMKQDEGFGKFFAYLNLFLFFMLVLVMGANYVMMFIGWEGVGLCSYLLIGFWWKNRDYSAAANKAFIMNRIGDLGFILGIFLLFTTFGSSDFDRVFPGAAAFATNDSVIVAITLLLFIGAIGKSAQIPLFTWLPDAMAGPTPVSALIHAATMVTAGVYMVARSNILFSIAPVSLAVVSVVGTITALMAALIALTQNDIKKVLAYSTVSQLGYMFVALGSSAYDAGVFHVMTHAFFKALLFLGAGSVIHAASGEQNIRRMGGLRKALPVTSATFLVGTLAISGIPPFSGFFSKDAIITASYGDSLPIFITLTITSVLTAAYMFRLYFVVFWGDFRGTHHQQEHLHESPKSITIPLIILAVLAAIGGFFGIPEIFGDHNWIHHYLAPVFSQNPRIMAHADNEMIEWMLVIFSIVILPIVLWIAYRRYALKKVATTINEEQLPFFYRLSFHKFYVDEIYQKVIVAPLQSIGDFFSDIFEKKVIDASVNGLGNFTVYLGSQLRRIQTGNIGFYVFAMVAGIILMLLFSLAKMNVF
ncbi:MAG: NADH-quinone oxidoreductase subunit L [Chitinophagales bacterium]